MSVQDAAKKLRERMKELGMEVSIGIAEPVSGGVAEIYIYRHRKVNPPVLKQLEADGWEGFKVRCVFMGPIKLAVDDG